VLLYTEFTIAYYIFWTFYLLNFIPHMGKISFLPSSKYCIHCTNFHETHNCSMALCVHLLYWMSRKPIKTHGTCKGKYIYALSMNISELIFTKPTFTWQLFVKKRLYRIHKNMTEVYLLILGYTWTGRHGLHTSHSFFTL
jgi:hypothetical protein